MFIPNKIQDNRNSNNAENCVKVSIHNNLVIHLIGTEVDRLYTFQRAVKG